VIADILTFTQRREIAALALKNRLPSGYFTQEYVQAGGLNRLRCQHNRPLQARSVLRRQNL
jgi:hypothetical protein